MNDKSKISKEFIQSNRELIGRNIRKYREQQGYSQDELAAMMEVHRTTISKVETGKFGITVDHLLRFSWHLNFDLSLTNRSEKNAQEAK